MSGKFKLIPDRWLNYTPIGEPIMGTRFIAFKVPLRKEVVESARVSTDLQLSCDSLVKTIPSLGMIIDLTNTNRYYDPQFFVKLGIRYHKVMIPGQQIPPIDRVHVFNRIVSDYLSENPNNTKLIGVHCTHGVNRTGYLICNFMKTEMKIQAEEAIKSFEAARGHPIERQNYRNGLMERYPSRDTLNSNPRNPPRDTLNSNFRNPPRGSLNTNWRNNDNRQLHRFGSKKYREWRSKIDRPIPRARDSIQATSSHRTKSGNRPSHAYIRDPTELFEPRDRRMQAQQNTYKNHRLSRNRNNFS